MQPRSDPSAPPVSRDIGVLRAGWGYASISDKIADLVLTRPLRGPWLAGFAITLAGTLVLLGSMAYLFVTGVGLWGINIPVAWGFAIANCVWWIGIGHAGTFISAVLLLLRQRWRTSINRFAEAMTLFAAAMAGLFPVLHLGRPWFFYWLAPYPDKMNLWPQWRSPLVWDFFAIGTYIIVSFLFWYLGLIPDLATLRDRAGTRFKRVAYGLFALGWRGEARHWARHASAYLLIAGLATPLVVSVHSVVSLDFAIGNTPGYHSTIFPPYFVAGALFSGFAMVLTLAIPLRRAFQLHDFITDVHLDHAAKVLLATGALVAYGYLCETFMAFYSGDTYEIAMTQDRWSGAYAPVYWSMLACNVVVPQLLWWRRVRRSALALFLLSLVINLGMWMERVTIVVQSLHHDFLPSSWGLFVPTLWDWVFLLGSISAFAWLFLVFIRVLPAISISEMRLLVKESAEEGPPTDVPPKADAAPAAGAVPPPAGAEASDTHRPWGLLAEFGTAQELLRATRAARQAGYAHVEAYAPFHVEGLAQAVGFARNRVALATLIGALLGGALGYFMQWYSAVVDYPVNIGGRPLHSWPMFVPVAFELTVLGGALTAFAMVIVGNRLPDLAHPVFSAPDFELATRNRFFLCLRADDPAFDAQRGAAWLDGQGPLRRSEVFR
ncbi:quinol:electron acceptor oxidoreductase subunit ActD [Azohydromonas lata]|uniref:Quinol:electron acceptor oxidoreductase subunit ActD n=1 Tax=Azohydromonas lata TaxID=45677 RepID=A0ABU5IE24_9BURK|nr:quinol:electron acceptor oxidoreductase subunit ActD [Azohydromonas lata]MDZ5457346.1 quinol:electron acceptor oxidoreductase subunit ActD [Azohydromonas lata]